MSGHALRLVCFVLGVALVVSVRVPLVQAYRAQALREGESALPLPEQTLVLSLGHREALADYLFAHTLVAYGLSFQEKRRFELAGRYLDAITTLAPTYRSPYLYADTLLTMQTLPARTSDYLKAREIQERGLRELPFDTELWSVSGQFSAYLAPPYLPAELQQEFRMLGARQLARACELASNNANIPYHCIAAAGILNKAGQREALIRMLSRMLAVNDDEQIKTKALRLLRAAMSERDKERYERRMSALNEAWQKDAPFVARTMLSLLGPAPDVWRCTGLRAFSSPGCHTNWSTWAEALESSLGRTQKSHNGTEAITDVPARDAPAVSGDFPDVVQ